MELKLFFSLITGNLYYVEEDEVKNLDQAQLPLKQKPSSSCKKCYGRFYVGRDINRNYYIPCPKCGLKCIDQEALKDKDIVVHSARQVAMPADESFNQAINNIKEVQH